MANNMNLTAQDIYEKEFHVDLKGYAPEEVDEYLDQVIEDYQNYDDELESRNQAILRYEEKIKELQKQIFTLNNENKKLQEKLKAGYIEAPNTDQVDILKRLSRLEAAVFGNQGTYNGRRGYRQKKPYSKNHSNQRRDNAPHTESAKPQEN
ncbi:cell division regulator GpsB [Catenisphaera adipataccumulans]|jgi:DivIVA domain-containing protein|uniref:DivIVA domain-containing protein n=1 Tax=Catenisphaera adipataccumulans TaxID=700500 RepID=A0A7W8CUY7_9FIRM|nr:cell division regulator GpsB [Catenisphaera adipataccumulans]MBB5182038.1 DivIVA domain-containing protein [Catenisphaera adipataccumulans]